MITNILQSFNLNTTAPHSGAFSSKWASTSGKIFSSYSPIDGSELGKVQSASADKDYEEVITTSVETFKRWRAVPAPVRGLLIREISQKLREHQQSIAKIISWESGKILREAVGEVQEAIDIADLAVGLSRQLFGKAMHSERPQHRMTETWHPLGAVGVITAFNYPCAVWAWNAFIAAVCGDTIVWKPSEKVPFSSIVVNKVCSDVAAQHGFPGLFTLLIGDSSDLGKKIAADPRIPLVSATGSTAMGRSVAGVVGARLGRSLLELGGNNAVIIMDDADLSIAIPSTLFGAVGTTGQRCTTTRRLIVHTAIATTVIEKLTAAYGKIVIGNPLHDGVMIGPLVNEKAVKTFEETIKRAVSQGGTLLYGGEVLKGFSSSLYVRPAIIKATRTMPIIREENFVPVLYVVEAASLEEAIDIQNESDHGLSSALFSRSVRSAELFMSPTGSDCGIANVNTGTSQAEVGGAFGGEKDTGGGREAGSDCWMQYMRRQTSTVNYSGTLLLAQALKFE